MPDLNPTFSTITATRVPGNYTEFSADMATTPSAKVHKILVVGQQEEASGADEIAVQVHNEEDGKVLFGRRSPLGAMCQLAFKNAKGAVEVYAFPLTESAGAAATKTLTFTGTATANGTLFVRAGGFLVKVPIVSGDAAAVVAATVETRFGLAENSDCPFTVGTAAAVATFTYAVKGTVGVDAPLGVNYYPEEKDTPGITVVVADAIAGTDVDIDYDDVFTAIGDTTQYDTLPMQHSVAAEMLKVETEFLDRWGGMRQIEGHAHAAVAGSVAAVGALGNARNSKHSTLTDCATSPSSPHLFAAGVAGVEARASHGDPALPKTGLLVEGVLAPREDEERTNTEQNTLLHDGITTITYQGRQAYLQRVITTEQTRNNVPADVFLDVNTPRTLALLRYEWNAAVAGRFPRHKYGEDGDRYSEGQAIVTDDSLRALAIGLAENWVFRGLMTNLKQFEEQIQVGRDSTDKTRANMVMPPSLMKQFRGLSTQVQFL